jgi:hypothetical protein
VAQNKFELFALVARLPMAIREVAVFEAAVDGYLRPGVVKRPEIGDDCSNDTRERDLA